MLKPSFTTIRRRFTTLHESSQGQDLIEYALMTGFLAIAVAAVFPLTLMPSVNHIFSRLMSTVAVLVP